NSTRYVINLNCLR
ncbi:hypothetical protein Q499_0772B, partial [Chlamydia suis MD56]